MQQQAIDQLDALPLSGELPFGLCLYREEWHPRVIGILAARIRERCHRPVVAFAPGEIRGVIKGSARSVAGLHIRDVLEAVAASIPVCCRNSAAMRWRLGSLQRSDLDAFTVEFDREVQRRIDREDLRGVVRSDGNLEAGDYRLELAELLPPPVPGDRVQRAAVRQDFQRDSKAGGRRKALETGFTA